METAEVETTAVVGGLEAYGRSEILSVKMRKCGSETHMYIKPPISRFAGICLDRGSSSSVRRSGGLEASVLSDLMFEATPSGNTIRYIPYAVFTCLPSEYVFTVSYQRFPYPSFTDEEDRHFYYVHWYIDDKHLKSFGPVSRQNFVVRTSLKEDAILADGYKLGFKIRCSSDITDSPVALRVLVTTSEDFVTGFKKTTLSMDEDERDVFDNFFHIPDTPLGCESSGDETTKFCYKSFKLVTDAGNAVCGDRQAEYNGSGCILTLAGQTYYGFTQTSYSWSYKGNKYYNYFYKYNGTHSISLSEYFYTRFNISGDITIPNFKLKFVSSGGSTGHSLWDDYDLPEINGYVVKSSSTKLLCNVTMQDAPLISVDEWADISENVVMDSVGEYILYRSRTKPVEVHVQTEECTSSLLGEICLCGVIYRNGGAIYSVNYCDGLARIGQVYGERKNRDTTHVTLINGMHIDITTRKGRIMGIGLSTNSSNEVLSDGEGLCTFTSGSYKYRNGAETSTNEGFLESWRLSIGESLLNPNNHKTFSWTDEYMKCGCPANATNRELTYSSNSYNYYSESYNVYYGFFQCYSDRICQANNTGEVWSDSLLPEFSIENVVARMEIRYVGKWPILHLFCDFDKHDGFRYKITWKLDGSKIYESGVMSIEEVKAFYITNEDLQTEQFLLEPGFACGVSVHDSNNERLLEPLYSDEIRAIEFVESEVLLRRGGDVTIQIKLNIPLVCMKRTSCSFDFKLFDPTESHNCKDSTIAFKNKHTCGERVIGIDSEDGLVSQPSIVNITVTTKNNDKYTLRDTFTLKMRLAANGETSRFWLHTFSKTITVFVRDEEVYWQGNYCYANNDPRLRTFDGQYYSLFDLGEFVMVRHKTLPLEVQLETYYYGWYSCGVTVRAGRDVYTINHCHGDHITGYLLADDRILKVKERSAHRYEIYLPHGMRIDVRVSSWWIYLVNVFIYPSPSDMNQVEGLCGNFDGDVRGDLIHSDGTVTWASYYYWWWWWISNTDAFVQSWWVGEEYSGSKSLTDIEDIEENLQSWYKDDVFCVCTGNNGNGNAKCSANERDTCLTPVEAPGLDVSMRVREKRSGQILDKEYKQRFRKMREKRAVSKTIVRRSVNRRSSEDVNATINANIEICRQTLSSSCGVMSVQENGLNVTFEELVNNCGQDKEVDSDTDWTALTCEAIEANVEQEVTRNVQFQEDHPEIATDILRNICVGNCTGNGLCVNGSCYCFSGFTANDCSLDLSRTIEIVGVTGDGICNTHDSDCACIRATTSGCVSTAVYKVTHSEFDKDNGWTDAGTTFGTVVYDNFNEVFVCPDINSRRKRSTNPSKIFADALHFSLSNDGSTFSNGSKVVILDTTCLQIDQINDTDIVSLKSDYCLVEGVCYAANEASPGDPCLICNVSADAFAWTRNNTDLCDDNEIENETSRQTSYIPYIIGAVAVLVVVIVVIVAILVVKMKLKKRVDVLVHDGTLYAMAGNTQSKPFELRKDTWVENQ